MFRSFVATTVVATVLGAGIPAVAATMVKEIQVEVDLDAIGNARAAEYWTDIADDLENAIVARLADRLAAEDEAGAKISVDIDEVTLATSLESAVGTADSRLAGRVNVTHETDNSAFDSYDLAITFEQAGPFFLPGTDLTAITTDSQEYYDAMIAAFANRVAENLD